MKKIWVIILVVVLEMVSMTGCGNNAENTSADLNTAKEEGEAVETADSGEEEEETVEAVDSEEEEGMSAVDLSGHILSVYCGAGMTDPFQEIADAFQEMTGCEMEITFANAGQIQTQINTAQEGDLFIAGSGDEVKPVEEAVTESRDLVKHIPVLVVKSGNPLGITGLEDLADGKVRVVLGDVESTPIGKIADKALTDAGILEEVNVVARTTTAPAIFNALTMDECDAIIVWKENVTDASVEIVDSPDMEKYIKTIPAASLSYCDDAEALSAFIEYLNTEEAHSVWTGYGYEVIGR